MKDIKKVFTIDRIICFILIFSILFSDIVIKPTPIQAQTVALSNTTILDNISELTSELENKLKNLNLYSSEELKTILYSIYRSTYNNGADQLFTIYSTTEDIVLDNGNTASQTTLKMKSLDGTHEEEVSSSIDVGELKKNLVEAEWLQVRIQYYLGQYFKNNYSEEYNAIYNWVQEFLNIYESGLSSGDLYKIQTLKDGNKLYVGESSNGTDEYIQLPTISSSSDSIIFNTIKTLIKYHTTSETVGANFPILLDDLNVDTNTSTRKYTSRLETSGSTLVDMGSTLAPGSSVANAFSGSIYDLSISTSDFETQLNDAGEVTGNAIDSLPYINITTSNDMTGFKNIMLAFLDFNQFLEIFKLRYGYDLTEAYTSEETSKIKTYLQEWRTQDGVVIDYILSILNEANEFYTEIGQSNFSVIESTITSNVKSFNELLSTFEIEGFKSGGESNVSISNYSDFDSLGIIRDLFESTTNSYMTTDVYNELLAWTSGFIPFSTNTYQTVSENIALSYQASKIWSEYYKLRQPLFITSLTDNVYSTLVNGSPTRVEYATLEEYINRIDREQDVFLFVNTYSPSEIKKINSENITVNDTINIGNTTTIEQSTSTDEADRESTSVNVTGDTKLDSSYLTSNARFFGPIYGSSYNYSVNNKTYKQSTGNGLSTTESNTISQSTISSLLEAGLSSSLSNIHSLEAIREDGQKVAIQFSNEELTSFMAQLMTPDNLALNHMLAWNVKEEKTYLLDILEADMSKPLYIDFLGNIVTESGYVVVPAIANATRFTDNASTTFLHAMFINFYPNVAITSDGKFSIDDKDKNKLLFYTSNTSWFFEPSDSASVVAGEYSSYYSKGIKSWFHDEKISIGRLNNGGDGFKNTIEVKFPRVDSFTSNSTITNGYVSTDEEEIVAEYKKALIKDRGYADAETVINMFTSDNFYSQRYGLSFFRKTDNAVYSWNKSFPVSTLELQGSTGQAYLNKIPATLNSYEVAALTELNKNMIDLAIEKKNFYINLDVCLSIAVALNNGSTDTTITDATFTDYKEKLKGDKITYFFGGLFESMYNPFVNEITINQLTFLPTPLNFTTIMDLSQKLPMILLGFLIIAVIALIIALITYGQRKGMMSLGDFVKGIVVVILMIVITLKGVVPIETFFNYANNRIMENEYLLMVLNQLEDEMKNKSTTYFSLEDSKSEAESPSIILKKLTEEEALQYRQASERPEDEFLYSPAYDNTKEYLFDDIYIQNLYLKIDLVDLLQSSYIDSYIQSNYTVKYEHTVDSSANRLAYYLPYFHILESLTYTVNQYSSATSNYYNTLTYNSGATKVTGRVKSYIDSIFFVAPEKLEEYIKVNSEDPTNIEAQLKGQINTSKTEGLEESEIVIDTYVNSSGEELIITENIATALEYIYNTMALENVNDWLGLNYVLDTTYDNIFVDEFLETTKATRWFPVLEKYKTDEAIQEAIEKVNNNVKKFIFKYIDPIADTVSDENLLRIIAFKATLEFNRVFNSASKGIVANGVDESETVPAFTFRYLYPYFIDGSYGDTDFISKLIYIPLKDIYRSNGNSIGYYLGNELSRIGLLLALIERVLFLFRFLARISAFVIFFILAIWACFAYIFKRKTFTFICLKTMLLMFLMISPFLLLEVMCFKLQVYLANVLGLNAVMLLNLVIGITLTALYGLCIKLLVALFKELFLSFRNAVMSGIADTLSKLPFGFEQEPTSYNSQYQESLPENYVSPSNYNEQTSDTDMYYGESDDYENVLPISQEEIENIDKDKYNVYQTKEGNYFISDKNEEYEETPTGETLQKISFTTNNSEKQVESDNEVMTNGSEKNDTKNIISNMSINNEQNITSENDETSTPTETYENIQQDIKNEYSMPLYNEEINKTEIQEEVKEVTNNNNKDINDKNKNETKSSDEPFSSIPTIDEI